MKIALSEQRKLKQYLSRSREASLLSAYLLFLEEREKLAPVVFLAERTIYKNREEVLFQLEKDRTLWRETEIIVVSGQASINAETKKIYICPYTGKAFGDNTHPHPQDAIYHWVSKESRQRGEARQVKKFLISEDPKMIRTYMGKPTPEVRRKVYSSQFTGKIFHDKETVVKDFIERQLRPMRLAEVPGQNRYEIEDGFLMWMQEKLAEEKLGEFVEAVEGIEELAEYAKGWVDDSE